jgi:hypothetical protein
MYPLPVLGDVAAGADPDAVAGGDLQDKKGRLARVNRTSLAEQIIEVLSGKAPDGAAGNPISGCGSCRAEQTLG